MVLQSLFCSWLRDNWTSACRKPTREGWSEVGSQDEGIRFVSGKTACDDITSCSAATKTNPIHSNSPTHADGRLASVGYESISLFGHQPQPY